MLSVFHCSAAFDAKGLTRLFRKLPVSAPYDSHSRVYNLFKVQIVGKDARDAAGNLQLIGDIVKHMKSTQTVDKKVAYDARDEIAALARLARA